MFDLINPSRIFHWIEKLINFINSIFFILLIIALTFALVLSPPDYLQGDSVRIMYVHVPSAWIGLASFTVIALMSILSFIFKIKNLNLITKSIAPIGLLFTCIAIITGSLWGQPTWGTWWAWDARITSMLVLSIFYILFILAHKLIENKDRANKVANLIAIIGLLISWNLSKGKSIPVLSIVIKSQSLQNPIRNTFYFDTMYQWFINTIVLSLGKITALFDRKFVNDKMVDGSANVLSHLSSIFRYLQTGKMYNYALGMTFGVISLAALNIIWRFVL